jgi:hypothetical protein
VQWPTGNTTIATWGVPNGNASMNMSSDWYGDIWFDCVGELDFAEYRTDCNFFLTQ